MVGTLENLKNTYMQPIYLTKLSMLLTLVQMWFFRRRDITILTSVHVDLGVLITVVTGAEPLVWAV